MAQTKMRFIRFEEGENVAVTIFESDPLPEVVIGEDRYILDRTRATGRNQEIYYIKKEFKEELEARAIHEFDGGLETL